MSARPPRSRSMRKPVSNTPSWVAPVAVVAGIALLVVAFLIIRWYTTPLPPAPLNVDATQQVLSSIAGLPQSELDAVGAGSANNLIKPVSGTPLTGPNGHPEVFYLGAEYCPYCAAERWPMIIALSRFGAFSGLKTTSSSSSDVYPNTPTFTFHGATYTSQYVDFAAVETTDRDRNPLESPTSAQQALANQYDTSGSIPFVDFGNRYALSGAMYLPDVLSGMTWTAVADALAQASSPQAKAILGSANLITAAVCKLTADQPASVCSSSTIQSIEKTLG
jgi:thiol-disulfide isomerase/thioredoxin